MCYLTLRLLLVIYQNFLIELFFRHTFITTSLVLLDFVRNQNASVGLYRCERILFFLLMIILLLRFDSKLELFL
jgi:hypothetical protein